MSDKKLLTAQQVAEYLSVSRNTVDALVRAGKIPPPIRLTSRLIRWDRAAIDKALANAPPDAVESIDWDRRISEAINGARRAS